MKTTILIILLVSCLGVHSFSQVTFKRVEGSKANYSISIPSNYYPKDAIGANVDMKYVNSEGASIVTVIRTLPSNVHEGDIQYMATPSDEQFVDELETNGLQNITLIKRGFLIINGVRSYIAYYRDTELYYHTITQFRKGKLINLTYTCENSKRETYMPYIFRVINSLKS